MLNEFKQYLLGIGKSENTALNYCDKVKLYLKWCLDSFGSEPQQLYRANVLDYISYMKTLKRYNPKSVNNHLSSLRSFNEFLIASGRQSELAILKNDFMKVQVQYANPCTVEQKDVCNVSRRTDYLIVGERPGIKLEKAITFGVSVMPGCEFESMLAQYDEQHNQDGA